MKKQYVVVFENTNPKNTTLRYLTSVINRYPKKTTAIEQATTFDTKASANKVIRTIRKDDLYSWNVTIVCR